MGRATLIDVDKPEDVLDNETEEQGVLDTQDSTEGLEENQEAQNLAGAIADADDSDIPEKYRGKSVKEIIEMHQNAEKHIGKQSSEVGELRKVVDDFIQGQLSAQKQNAPDPVSSGGTEDDDEIDFFVDPSRAVQKSIESHPAIKEARQFAQEQRKASTLAQLQAKHPDMQQVVQDPKFAEWIQASKIRTELFVRADQQYDYDAADALFTDWKERQTTVKQAADVEMKARKTTAKAASTGAAKGTGEPNRRKVYRRADIIKLMKTDPQRYQQLQPEIMAAYREGRVK